MLAKQRQQQEIRDVTGGGGANAIQQRFPLRFPEKSLSELSMHYSE